ncbi:MAG: double-strand break repair helicase AddA [Parvibaculum sp.]|nr:double-strand break repair helicase AddA [Parvibaculum sp.]
MSGVSETKKPEAGDAQQLRASEPEHSVWVSANAGAGKTHALTTRVTRLLLNGTAPERILCLTYTKAAAAEMSSRLFARLGAWAMESDEKLQMDIAAIEGPLPDANKLKLARRLFARAIETPGGLKIQTIHAFCQSLLGRFPLEADVPPHFNVLDERGAAELLAEVRLDVLDRARADEDGPLGSALAFVVGRVDETRFDELMGEIAQKRTDFAHLLEAHGSVNAIVAMLRETLDVLPEETSETAIANFFRAEALPTAILKKAVKVMGGSTAKTDVKYADIFASVLETKTRGDTLHETYVSVFLKADGDPRKDLMTKKLREANSGIEEALRVEQERVLGHMAYLKAVHVAEASEAILRIGYEVLTRFEEAKRVRALLDYNDMIARTRALLMQQNMTPWVLYKLDGGIDHILVDEAQDTSPDQWDIVSSLTEEFFAGLGAHEKTRTLFAVGDEKQSIYSFQGADPKRFDEMQRAFGQRARAAELEWDPVRLVRSFRSAPQMLQAVDAVFARAEASDGLTASGVVDEHIAVRREDAGRVELWDLEVADDEADEEPWDAPLNYVSASDPKAKLALRIADTIEGWIKAGEVLPSKGRAIEPGDILILVRRRNAFVSEMVRLLKKKGIAVAGADRMVVTDEIAVMDLMALGAFTLLPQDDLTLAVLLKSPLVGLDEDALFVLAHDRGEGKSLWQSLQENRGTREDFSTAHTLLSDFLDRADFEPPYEFFAHVLGEAGGRRKLLARLGSDANDPVDEFLNLALTYERDHAASMQGFLHWVSEGSAEIKRDMDKGRNEVRIMTVHGAKGLEADIVFMPDTCAAPGGNHDPSFLKLETAPPLLVWPVSTDEQDPQTRAARDAHRSAQAQEYRRLLYVAMTRARDRLYICGYRGAREPAEDCWYNLIGAALKPLAVEMPQADGRAIWRLDGKQLRDVQAGDVVAVPTFEKLGDWAWAKVSPEPALSRPLAPSRLPPDGMEEPAALSPLAGDQKKRFQRGTLIHRLLQTLPDLADDAREAAAHDLLASPALGLDEAACDEIIGATLAVLREPKFAEIFGDGSRAEAALVGQISFAGKPVLVSGQIDRLCVGDTRVLIVDYKTNRPAPPDIADVNPAYFAQMAAYRAVLHSIYPDRDVVCALLWTDGPKLMELPAARLDAALATRSSS